MGQYDVCDVGNLFNFKIGIMVNFFQADEKYES